MKRYTYLWQDITSFANLLHSARQAQKGKRFRENVPSITTLKMN
jgi:hypothetical protein